MRRTLEKLGRERQDKENDFTRNLEEIKKKTKNLSLLHSRSSTRELIAGLTELIELQASLADAKDREWDALGSNHVGLIFKSMEWRVDKLAAEYEDVKILMKKFVLLREQLARLLALLEEKKMPAPAEVREIHEPLEDWQYAGFENRFRGSEEEVKKQQRDFVSYFAKKGAVLDLGCGRGEFLELLRENGVDAAGVDSNSQMVEICLDKGLRCEKGDILEKLADREDGSLAGIFSSQVIEHLSPVQLKRLIELSYQKLGPSGVLVLETINPASVFTLVQVYYLDLSHQKPVHPQALKFMLEASGFENVEVKYSVTLENEQLKNLPGADERTALLNQNIDRLNDLLFAPANYAAIAARR
jgi:SAM-dependent methyltransferase